MTLIPVRLKHPDHNLLGAPECIIALSILLAFVLIRHESVQHGQLALRSLVPKCHELWASSSKKEPTRSNPGHDTNHFVLRFRLSFRSPRKWLRGP